MLLGSVSRLVRCWHGRRAAKCAKVAAPFSACLSFCNLRKDSCISLCSCTGTFLNRMTRCNQSKKKCCWSTDSLNPPFLGARHIAQLCKSQKCARLCLRAVQSLPSYRLRSKFQQESESAGASTPAASPSPGRPNPLCWLVPRVLLLQCKEFRRARRRPGLHLWGPSPWLEPKPAIQHSLKAM